MSPATSGKHDCVCGDGVRARGRDRSLLQQLFLLRGVPVGQRPGHSEGSVLHIPEDDRGSGWARPHH